MCQLQWVLAVWPLLGRVQVLERELRSAVCVLWGRGGRGSPSTIYMLSFLTDLLPKAIENKCFLLRVSSFLLGTVMFKKNERKVYVIIQLVFFFNLNFSMLQKLGIKPSINYYQVSLALAS